MSLTPFAFGCAVARIKKASWWDDYNEHFSKTYGFDLRIPATQEALLQTLVAGGVGAGIGAGRGLLYPGYEEKVIDPEKNIVQRKKRTPFRSALSNALIGGLSGAGASYASQTALKYKPEMLELLQKKVPGFDTLAVS